MLSQIARAERAKRRQEQQEKADPSWELVENLVRANGQMSLEEVGDVFGVSRERIRQIEERALRKLRGELEAVGVIGQEVLQHFDSVKIDHPLANFAAVQYDFGAFRRCQTGKRDFRAFRKQALDGKK